MSFRLSSLATMLDWSTSLAILLSLLSSAFFTAAVEASRVLALSKALRKITSSFVVIRMRRGASSGPCLS